jgi:hypothetical protein
MKLSDNRPEYSSEELEKIMNAKYPWYEELYYYFYRAVFRIIDFFRYDLVQGLKNFWFYKGVIWRHRWWDYAYADDVIIKMFKERADLWKNSHYVGLEEDEAKLKEIVENFEKMKEAESGINENDEEQKFRTKAYEIIGENRFWD